MRRHPALIPISREHRKVLMLAQLLKKNAPPYKGMPTDLAGKQTFAATVYRSLLQAHMQREEERLFPVIEGINEDTDALINELKQEHTAIHTYFSQLLKGKLHEDQADDLGHMLEKHVRKEERLFFEKIQQLLTGEQLLKLEKVLYQ